MPEKRSKVIRIRSADVVDNGGRVDEDILYHMLETGLISFFDDTDYLSRLGSVFSSDDTIGMKVNTLGGPGISTHPELCNSLSGILVESGIQGKKQIIWDRSDRELKRNGFSISAKDGPYCFGTDHRGIGYSKNLVSKGQIGGLLSNIQEDLCSGIINMSVLKDHSVAGITCSLKNYFGSIHNPNKYHDNGCDPYVADLYSLEQISGKERLIVVDCLNVQFHGGPAYKPQWTIDYGGLLIGSDPVAVDTVGYGIIEDLRANAGKDPLKGSKREPIYIKRASDYGLGSNDPAKIDLMDLKI